MNTCRTCTFWGRYRDGECDLIDIGNETKKVASGRAEITVRVQDDSGLSVGFRTSPEFGCVLHEERV